MPLARLLTIALSAQLALLGWIAGAGVAGALAGACLGAAIGFAWGGVALRRAPALAAMLAFGGLGMTFGWWADLGFRSAAAMAAHARLPSDLLWCRSAPGPASLAGVPSLGHVLSWMTAGMLALGMPAVALVRSRVGCPHADGMSAMALCAVAMALGMLAGSWGAGAVAVHLSSAQVVIADWAAMSAGMLAAMALAERIARWLAQIPRHAAIATSAQPAIVTRKPSAPA